jgi:hypothetical protein
MEVDSLPSAVEVAPPGRSAIDPAVEEALREYAERRQREIGAAAA